MRDPNKTMASIHSSSRCRLNRLWMVSFSQCWDLCCWDHIICICSNNSYYSFQSWWMVVEYSPPFQTIMVKYVDLPVDARYDTLISSESVSSHFHWTLISLVTRNKDYKGHRVPYWLYNTRRQKQPPNPNFRNNPDTVQTLKLQKAGYALT